MKRTKIITIYDDPMTKTKPEGRAHLLDLIEENRDTHMQYWLVHFVGDPIGQNVKRFVYVPKTRAEQ